MLNSVVSIGEICPEPRPLVAPPHRQLVLSSQLASCCVLVRLWVLLADCRSVSLLPPPLALSLLVSPSHYSSDSGLLFTIHPLPPSLTVLLFSLFSALLPVSGPTGVPWLLLIDILGPVCVFFLTHSVDPESLDGRQAWILPGPGGSSDPARAEQACGVPESSLGWPSLWPGRIRKNRGSSLCGYRGREGPKGRYRRRDKESTFCRQ